MARLADTGPAFELRRFAVAAVGAEAALVELEVRWPSGVPAAGRSRLLAGDDDTELRIGPSVETVHGRLWRATFAVPARYAARPLAIVAGGYVVDLPDPDPAGPEDERVARLAREGNTLRRRLDVAEEAAARAEVLEQERDAVRGELEAARAELERTREDAGRERERLEGCVADLRSDIAAAADERDAERAATEQQRAAEIAVVREELGQHLAAERVRLEGLLAQHHAEYRTERERLEARMLELDAARQDAEGRLLDVEREHEAQLAQVQQALAEQHEAELAQLEDDLSRQHEDDTAQLHQALAADRQQEAAGDGEDGGQAHDDSPAADDTLRGERDELRAERDVLAARVQALEHELGVERTTRAAERRAWSERHVGGESTAGPATAAFEVDDDPTTDPRARRRDAEGANGNGVDDAPTVTTPTRAWELGRDDPTTTARVTHAHTAGDEDYEDEDEDDYEPEPFTPPPRPSQHHGARSATGGTASGAAIARAFAIVLLLLGLLVVGYVLAGGLN